MEKRRKIQRHKTLKAGTINFNRAGGVDCRVRNLSPAGACLEVASQIGIPNEFVLVVETDHMKAPVPGDLAHRHAPRRRLQRLKRRSTMQNGSACARLDARVGRVAAAVAPGLAAKHLKSL